MCSRLHNIGSGSDNDNPYVLWPKYHMFNKDIMFVPLGSMGDAFVYAPIIHHFSKITNCVHVPVLNWIAPTLHTLFQENMKVKIFEFDQEHQVTTYAQTHDVLELAHPHLVFIPYNGTRSCVLWDEQIYTFYNLPFSLRYEGFHIPKQLPRSQLLYRTLVQNPRYILTHTEIGTHIGQLPLDVTSWRSTVGLESVDQYQIIELGGHLTNNLMDYVDLILHASEIHCVPSCVQCLVDSMASQITGRLFWHDIRKDTIMRINNTWNQHKWCVINYEHKY